MSLDFMIVGAAKAGTTWLADMLRQHPDNIDQKSNATGAPKYKYFNKFLVKNKLKSIMKILRKLGISQWGTKIRHTTKGNCSKPKLINSDELYLHGLFIKDIEKLEKLLDKDLSFWK